MGKMVGYFKLPLQGFCKVKAPENVCFLNVAEHRLGFNVVYGMFGSSDGKDHIEHNFYCAFTGEILPDVDLTYIGTINRKDGYVIHVFEVEQ